MASIPEWIRKRLGRFKDFRFGITSEYEDGTYFLDETFELMLFVLCVAVLIVWYLCGLLWS